MRRAIIAGIALVSAAALADMYKWVDEKGITHYSESPPPDEATAKKATKMELKVVPPSSPDAKPYDWKAKEADSRTQNVQKVQEERAKAEAAAKVTAERKQQCEAAVRQVNLYQQQVPIYSMNDKGERSYVEDADRASRLEAAQDRMRKYCD
jgi:hypothetical protein